MDTWDNKREKNYYFFSQLYLLHPSPRNKDVIFTERIKENNEIILKALYQLF